MVTGKEDASSLCAMLEPVTTISSRSAAGASAAAAVSAARTCTLHPTRHAPAISTEYAGRERDPMLISFPIFIAVLMVCAQNRAKFGLAGLDLRLDPFGPATGLPGSAACKVEPDAPVALRGRLFRAGPIVPPPARTPPAPPGSSTPPPPAALRAADRRANAPRTRSRTLCKSTSTWTSCRWFREGPGLVARQR